MKLADLNDQNLHWKLPLSQFRRLDKELNRARQGELTMHAEPMQVGAGQMYLVLGPRQVGKTTFLKQHIAQRIEEGVPPRQLLYLSADTCRSQDEFRRTLRQFLSLAQAASSGVIYLDEVTRLPGWAVELKRLADQGVTDRFPIVATGSSAYDLRRESEQLPGRGAEGNSYIMRPLNFRSFVGLVASHYARSHPSDAWSTSLTALRDVLPRARARVIRDLPESAKAVAPFQQELELLFRHYLAVGGYPRAIKDALEPREGGRPQDFLTDSTLPQVSADVAEVLVRDVLGDVARAPRNDTLARHLLRALLKREGQRGSYNMLGKELGANHSTVMEYLSVLEGSYLLITLEPIDPTSGEPKPRRDKKFHLTDPLLRSALESHITGLVHQEVTERMLDEEERLGRIVESTVVAHLAQHGEVPYRRDRPAFLGYWYDARKREVDVVLKEPDGSRCGIEVKFEGRVRGGSVYMPEGLDAALLLSKDDFDLDDPVAPVIPVCLALAVLPASPRHLVAAPDGVTGEPGDLPR